MPYTTRNQTRVSPRGDQPQIQTLPPFIEVELEFWSREYLTYLIGVRLYGCSFNRGWVGEWFVFYLQGCIINPLPRRLFLPVSTFLVVVGMRTAIAARAAAVRPSIVRSFARPSYRSFARQLVGDYGSRSWITHLFHRPIAAWLARRRSRQS